MITALGAAAVLIVTLVFVWSPWADDPENEAGSDGLSRQVDLEVLDAVEPSPDCASGPQPRPEGATIALDVVRIDGSCLDVDTVWTTEDDASDVIEALRADPDVRTVSVSPTASIQQAEELRPDLWGLDFVGAKEPDRHPWPPGAGVTVAVIDTGIDATHPDLAGSVVDRMHYATEDPARLDADSHGTHVASTIAASADGEGVIGVAPSVGLLDVPVRLERSGILRNGDAVSWVAGLAWAVNNGADIANLSLGSLLNDYSDDACVRDDLTGEALNCLDAANLAVAFANRNGVAVVAASGNRGTPGADRHALQVPGVLDGVTGVGSIDTDGSAAAGGSRNDSVDLMAPGVEIVSAIPTYEFDANDPDQLLGANDAPYRPMDGTSMAAPHVSGAYAALMEAAPDADLDQLTEALTVTAHPMEEAGTGAGAIDIPAALRHLADTVDAEAPGVTPILYQTGGGPQSGSTYWAWTGGDPVEIASPDSDTFYSGFVWAPDGNRLAGTVWDGQSGSGLSVWDLDTGQNVTAPFGEDCSQIVFPGTGNGTLVVVCGDRLEHYDSATLELVESVGFERDVPDPRVGVDVVGVDADRVYAAEYDGASPGLWTIEFDTGAYEQLVAFEELGAGAVQNAVVDPVGDRIALLAGSMDGCTLAESRMLVLELGTLEVLADQAGLPDGVEGSAAFLGGAYFNGGELHAHPEYRMEVDAGGFCSYSALRQGGLWRLSSAGWELIAPESVEFAVPIADVANDDFARPGVFVIDVDDAGQGTCTLVELPSSLAVFEVDSCALVEPVTGPATGPVDLNSWGR